MAKKANKAAADDWHQEQKATARVNVALEEQETALWAAANKRDNWDWPDPTTLTQLGYSEAAAKVSQAYRLLEEADYLFRKQKDPQDYQG